MAQRTPANPNDPTFDDRLTFTDVTMLSFLAVVGVTLAVLILLGAVSAEHRIGAVVGRAAGLW